jgi:rod shape-determining protein MreD
MREFFIAFFVLLLQTSVLTKYFSIQGISPDIVTIVVILFALNKPLYNSIKLATVIGLFQDIFSSSFFIKNLLIKNMMVLFAFSVKKYFFTYGFFIKSLIIILLSLLDIFVKIAFTYFKTGIIYISPGFLLYALLNFLIFGVYYVINEYKKG